MVCFLGLVASIIVSLQVCLRDRALQWSGRATRNLGKVINFYKTSFYCLVCTGNQYVVVL